MFSSIAQWFHTWRNPVTAVSLQNLTAASRDAARAVGETAGPYPHVLYPTSRDVRVRPSRPIAPLLRIAGLIHGRPMRINLWQNQASGVAGPFARTRKTARKARITKENAILFWQDNRKSGLQDGKVLKASLAIRSQAREIRMLRMLAGLNGLAPALLAYDHALRWLVMEKVEAARAMSAEQQAQCYLKHLAPRYFAFWGCRAKPVRRHFSEKISDQRIAEEAGYLGLHLPGGWQTGQLDWSITHGGGICEETLLLADGRVCLLDWEKARLAPVAEDLLQVFEYRPQETLALFETLTTGQTLAVADQLALLLCRRSSSNRARKNPIAAKLHSDRICAAHLAALSGSS